jgi:hypothetical protein
MMVISRMVMVVLVYVHGRKDGHAKVEIKMLLIHVMSHVVMELEFKVLQEFLQGYVMMETY